MANADEVWGLGSGLALDGMTGIISDAEFGFNASIGAGICCLNLTIQDTEDDNAEEVEQSFSCGNKFEASKDGSELLGKGPIIKTSNYGLLLGSLAECVDDISVLELDPRNADTWKGMLVSWGSVVATTTNPTTGVSKESTKFIITDFHGRGDDPAPATKGTAKKAATKTVNKTVNKKAPASDHEGIEDDLWNALMELAGEHEDHGDFATAALDIPEVDGNKAAQKAIMGTKPGSVWAAKGEG